MNFLVAIFSVASSLQAISADVPAKYLAATPQGEHVLARVGGKPILASEIEPLLRDWRTYEVLQDVITHRILVAESTKAKVSVSDEEIDREIASQLAQMTSQVPAGTTAQKWLLEQGFPKSRLYLRVKTQLLLDRIAALGFDPAQFVDVATIIVPVKSQQASDVADAITRAQRAYEDLVKGASWDAVLKRVNPDPRFVESRGHIGWREISAFPEATRIEIGALGVGGVTKPVQTQNGIQIFRIQQLGRNANAETVKTLKDTFLQASRQTTLDRIRKEAKVEQLYPPQGPGI